MSLPSQSDITATPSKMSDDSQSHEKVLPMTSISFSIASKMSFAELNIVLIPLFVLLFLIRVL